MRVQVETHTRWAVSGNTSNLSLPQFGEANELLLDGLNSQSLDFSEKNWGKHDLNTNLVKFWAKQPQLLTKPFFLEIIELSRIKNPCESGVEDRTTNMWCGFLLLNHCFPFLIK